MRTLLNGSEQKSRLFTGFSLITALLLTLAACGGGGGGGDNNDAEQNIELIELTGTVSGLLGTVVLQNGSDTLEVSENGEVTIEASVPVGTEYDVTVKRNPIGQVCQVGNGTGTTDTSDISVSVSCSEALYLSLSDRDHGQEIWVTDGTEAGTQLLVDTLPGVVSSKPIGMKKVGDKLFYVGLNQASRLALFMTDGSQEGTKEVAELFYETLPEYRLADLEFTLADAMVIANGNLFVQRVLSETAAELISVDQLGTVNVIDSYTFEETSYDYQIFLLPIAGLGNTVVYSRFIERGDVAIYTTDGATASDLDRSATYDYYYGKSYEAGTTFLYFLSIEMQDDESEITQLWRTDGTVENTIKVDDYGSRYYRDHLQIGSFIEGSFHYVKELDDSVKIFSVNQSTGAPEEIFDFGLNNYADVLSLFKFNNELHFYGFYETFENEGGDEYSGLFKLTNNTVEQIVETNFDDYGFESVFKRSVEANSKLFFIGYEFPVRDDFDALAAGDVSTQRAAFDTFKIFSYDGSNAAQVIEEYNIPDYFYESGFGNLHAIGNQLLYFAYSEAYGSEPYVTSGEVGTATLLKDINTATADSEIDRILPVEGGVLTSGYDPTDGYYHLMGVSEQGAESLGLHSSYYNVLENSALLGANTYLMLDLRDEQDQRYYQMVVTDGTAAGTSLVSLDPASDIEAWSNSLSMIEHNGDIYLLTNVGEGNALLKIEIDPQDTTVAKATFVFEPGLIGINSVMSLDSNTLAVTGTEDDVSILLLLSGNDLTETRFSASSSEVAFLNVNHLQLLDGDVYFWSASSGATSSDHLFMLNKERTEATQISTQTNVGSWQSKKLYKVQGELVAVASSSLHVLDDQDALSQQPFSVSSGSAALFEGFLYVSSQGNDDSELGYELYRFDGTDLELVADIYQGESSSRPASMSVINDQLMFFANTFEHGAEPWTSDGTETGTQLFRDIFPGSTGSTYTYSNSTGIGNGLFYFVADDYVHGREVWQTDGTLTGTKLVFDSNTASKGSWLNNFNSCRAAKAVSAGSVKPSC